MLKVSKLKMSCVAAVMAASMGAVPASAHHSFSMFDSQAEKVIEGTVTEFQWTNPHSWIEIDVPDGKGGVVHYSVEGGSIAGLARLGWSRKSILPGDKIKLVMHPLRDGRPGGSLMGVVLANGKQLGESLTAPPEDRLPIGSGSGSTGPRPPG